MYTEDDDSEHKIALTLVLGIAIFVIAGLLGFLGLSGYFGNKDVASTEAKPAVTAPAVEVAAPAAVAAASTVSNLADDQSAVVVENGVVKFYFASGKADLAKGGKEALAEVVKGIAAGQKASISGFHDTTGDPAKNAELAKKRAMSVRDELLGLGVTEDKLELVKPAEAQASGSNSEARRVEVMLVK